MTTKMTREITFLFATVKMTIVMANGYSIFMKKCLSFLRGQLQWGKLQIQVCLPKKCGFDQREYFRYPSSSTIRLYVSKMTSVVKYSALVITTILMLLLSLLMLMSTISVLLFQWFLIACLRFNTPPCWLICRSVGLSFGWLVGLLHFAFFRRLSMVNA